MARTTPCACCCTACLYCLPDCTACTAHNHQVLHEHRYRETWDVDADTGAWMEALCRRQRMYRTPARMNDDLFWMYATIHAKQQGRLVSHGWGLLLLLLVHCGVWFCSSPKGITWLFGVGLVPWWQPWLCGCLCAAVWCLMGMYIFLCCLLAVRAVFTAK